MRDLLRIRHLFTLPNNISFASGGTGAVTDPVLIGVASGATSLSFVVDYNNVMIPNFNATSNDSFRIQLVGIPVGATIASFSVEYMEALDTNNQLFFFFPPHNAPSFPISLVAGESLGMFNSITGQSVTADPQIIRMLQQVSDADVGTLGSRIRYTVSITQPMVCSTGSITATM